MRLADLPDYIRTPGFSADLMRSHTFPGTPRRHRDVHVGHFFLAEKEGAPAFTEEDEEVLMLFALQARTAIANARARVLERPPDLRGVTRRLSPRPPYPSPYRPGTLTVLTKVAERRTECLFTGGITYLPTLRHTGFSPRCSVSPRREESR